MNVLQHGAGHARRTGPVATGLAVLFILLVLLLCVAGPAAAYVPGKLVWAKTTGAAGQYRFYRDVVRAPAGMVYAVGAVEIAGDRGRDFLVVKHRSDGSVAWSKTYDGGGGALIGDVARAAVSDGGGNLYVTGAVDDGGASTDIVTIKYSASGTRLWVKPWSGVSSGDNPVTIALDPRGGVVVAGGSWVGDAGSAVLIDYDAAGNERWTRVISPDAGNPSDSTKWPADVAVDAAGDVYLAMNSQYAGVQHAVVARFSATDGSLIESASQYNAAGSAYSAIAVRGGQVVCVGWAADVSSEEGALATRYDLAISTENVLLYQDARGASARDFANDVAIGARGIYIAGYTNHPPAGGSGFWDKALLLKWDGVSATPAWPPRLYAPSGQGARADTVVVDGADTIYVGGEADTQRSEENMLVVKYSATGGRVWARTWHDTGTDDDWVGELLLGPTPTLYVAGGGSIRNGEHAVLLRYNR